MTQRERGNGALDVLLFMPLGLFLLFVVTDGGLSLVEKAGIADALRSGLNAEVVHAKEERAIQLDEHYALRVDQEALERLASDTADEIAKRVKKTKKKLTRSDGPRFGIEVSAIVFDVNPDYGTIEQGDRYRIMAQACIPERGIEEESANISGYPYLSRDDFIRRELRRDALAVGQRIPSRYAVPLGLAYRAEDPSRSQLKYLEQSVVLYAEVRAVTEGINQGYTRKVLGNFYAVQEQELHMLRTQVR